MLITLSAIVADIPIKHRLFSLNDAFARTVAANMPPDEFERVILAVEVEPKGIIASALAVNTLSQLVESIDLDTLPLAHQHILITAEPACNTDRIIAAHDITMAELFHILARRQTPQ
jgi:hypothetical protein